MKILQTWNTWHRSGPIRKHWVRYIYDSNNLLTSIHQGIPRMYYASCTIPRSKAVQYWIQPCPIAATLCFCHGCENVELQILADARFPAVRKNTQRNQPKQRRTGMSAGKVCCGQKKHTRNRKADMRCAAITWPPKTSAFGGMNRSEKTQLNSGSPAHASVASRHWHARRIGICLPPLCAADFHMIQLVASPGWTLRHELEHAASNLEAILFSQVVPQSFPELWTPLTKNIVHVFVPFRHLFPRPEHKVRMRSHPAVHPALSILQATGGDFPRLSSLSLSFPISFLSTFPLKVFPITLSFFAFSFPFAIPHPWPIFFSFLAITFSFGLPTPTRPRSPVVWPIIIPGVKTSVDCLRWRLPCLWDRRLRWSRCLRWCSAGLGAPGSGAPLWSLHLFHRPCHQVLAHATFAILLNDPSPVSAVRVCQSIGEHLAQPHKRIGRHRVGTDRCGGQKSHTTVAAGRKATLLDNYHLWLKIWIWDCLMNDVLWFCRMKHSNVKLQLTTKVENIRMNVNYMSEWHFLMHLLMINKISHAYGAKANMPDLIYSADKKLTQMCVSNNRSVHFCCDDAIGTMKYGCKRITSFPYYNKSWAMVLILCRDRNDFL